MKSIGRMLRRYREELLGNDFEGKFMDAIDKIIL